MIRGRWFACFVLGGILISAGTGASSVSRAAAGDHPHRTAYRVPALHGAVALGTLVALDRKSDIGEFRIRCGWHATRGVLTDQYATVPRGRLHPGLWKVSLRGFDFTTETYPVGQSSGIANEVTLNDWERRVTRVGWTGRLFLPDGLKPGLSDGPTTDVCRGILG